MEDDSIIKKELTKIERFFISIGSVFRTIFSIIIIVSLPLIYLLVLNTGGLKYSYSHTMYIPIVLAGMILGKRWGIVVGILAGLLLGPLMALDVSSGESQLFINWFFRMIIYTIIGFLSGLFSTILKNDTLKIIQLYSLNPETMIPNAYTLSSVEINVDVNKFYLLNTIMINNNHVMIELLGNNSYLEVIKLLYDRLRSKIKNPLVLVQGGSNKLWIATCLKDLKMQIDEMLDILKEPITIGGIPLYIEFSIGATIVKGSSKCKDISSFRQSDIAARDSFKNGNPYELFVAENIMQRNEYELLGSFEQALAENQTFLVYQPKINLVTNKTESFEALIRWNHPKRGLITPDKFIPAVEETKLIHSITEWVLNTVCQKIIDFKKHNIDIKISMNISVKNLSNPNFFNQVFDVIQKYGINPSQLELEITESKLMDNPLDNITLLKEFKNNGITTTIDDFGVGHSSLQYLARLPIITVKIDKYFIQQMVNEEAIKSIVEATVAMSHKLGYTVVAEGIENEMMMKASKELKCDYGQGYMIARPMTGDKVIDWYKENI